MSSTVGRIGLIVFLAAILVLDSLSARHDTLTYDEPTHFRYGSNILSGDASRFIDGTMPFSALNALPQRIASAFPPGALRNALARVEIGRIVTILFSMLLAYYVFRWTKELYGPRSGLFSLLLYTVSPNIIAHARLITTDVYAAGMVTIATYYFWRFLSSGGWRLATLSAVFLGLSQLAKYSCIFLYPIFGVILTARYGADLARAAKMRAWEHLGRYLAKFLKLAVFFALVSLVVINAGFLFNKSLMPLGEYEFKSVAFKSMQAKMSALKGLPVPLPKPYLQGLDWGKNREETGRGFGSMYLLGHLRDIGGFKGYYSVAFLYKEPIATQLLILLAIILYVRNRRRYSFMRNELFLAAPVVFYAVYMNFFFNLQIGIRHYLVVFPFLYIFCGSLVSGRVGNEGAVPEMCVPGRKMKVAISVLLAYLVISVLSYFPHYIPYFNEMVWDRRQGYKILADSNVDWGQGGYYAKQYVAQHPGAYLEQGLWHMKTYREKHLEEYLHPQFPDSGLIVVNVNNYVGIYHPHRYKWLREGYKPIDQIAYSYLVFRISPGDSIKIPPVGTDEPVADSLGESGVAR